jgi:hypothetical protein
MKTHDRGSRSSVLSCRCCSKLVCSLARHLRPLGEGLGGILNAILSSDAGACRIERVIFWLCLADSRSAYMIDNPLSAGYNQWCAVGDRVKWPLLMQAALLSPRCRNQPLREVS